MLILDVLFYLMSIGLSLETIESVLSYFCKIVIKVPERSNIKEKTFILACGFRDFST
jgi:hypothetical protein